MGDEIGSTRGLYVYMRSWRALWIMTCSKSRAGILPGCEIYGAREHNEGTYM